MRRFLLTFVVASTFIAALVACTGRDHAGAEQPARAGNALFREASISTTAPADAAVPGPASLAPLIERLKPAVVNISTTTVTKLPRGVRRGQLPDGFERFFGLPSPHGDVPDEQRGQGLGSGFVLNGEGFILTNHHVIKDATDIRVKLSDDREFAAKVIGKDPLTDVALIKLNSPPKDLPTVVLGDSDALRQGDFVLALGSPFGLSGTATHGHRLRQASRRGRHRQPVRRLPPDRRRHQPRQLRRPALQPPRRGGRDQHRHHHPQIGQGIGFAVPITLAKALLPQLQSSGKVVRGYVGVSLSELTPDLAPGLRDAGRDQGGAGPAGPAEDPGGEGRHRAG